MTHINFNKSGDYKVHVSLSGKTTCDEYRCRDLDEYDIDVSDLVYNKGYKEGQKVDSYDEFGCFYFFDTIKSLLDMILDPSVPSGKSVEFRDYKLRKYYDNYSENVDDLDYESHTWIEFDLYFDVLR